MKLHVFLYIGIQKRASSTVNIIY